MADECIQVVVRCRPMNTKEKNESRKNIIDIDVGLCQVQIRNLEDPKVEPKIFTYNRSYDENTQQRLFYEDCCFSLVESVLQGFNATVFAYGQTGCGKSFTMQGPNNTLELRGVIPNSFNHIFEAIKGSSDVQYLLRCSYLEIYNEEIRDLLVDPKNAPKCEIKEDSNKGIYIKNLSFVTVDTEVAMARVLESGMTNRHVAATLMNSESSRSHSIFTIVIEMSTVDQASGKEMLRAGKLNLVDLAGSERQKKTGATGAALLEGTKINLSLSNLGNVISALADGKSKHIPYRDSKLTRLLQDSLGGNTKTLMIAAISPADYNYDETLSTLRYANRAKNIKNKPKINEDPKDTMLREYKEEIEKLRQMLAQGGAGGGVQILPTLKESGDEADASEAVRREAAVAREELRQKEQEIAEERRQREELNRRLVELQGMLMGQRAGAAEESLEDSQERNEAQVRHTERLRKQESKLLERAESNRKFETRGSERDSLEAELDELGKASNKDSEAIITKIKKKYEKKLSQARKELEDAREEFSEEQQLLLESLMEQRRDTRLLELICESVVPRRELNNILEFSKWDEDNQEWILPPVHMIRGEEEDRETRKSGSNSPSSGSRLPSISAPKQQQHDESTNMTDVYTGAGKLSELKIPLSTSLPSALPFVSNSPKGRDSQQQQSLSDYSPKASQSLPVLAGNSRPPSHNVVGSSKTSMSMSMPQITNKNSQQQQQQYDSSAAYEQTVPKADNVPKKKKDKDRRSSKSPILSPADTPAQIPEGSIESTAGPLSDWGFSADAADMIEPTVAAAAEYAYVNDEDFEQAEDESLVKEKKQRRKKKKRASNEELPSTEDAPKPGGFLPKLF